MNHVALDAIPEPSDTQVIIYSRWDRSPDIIEDQITYPMVSAMLGAPKVRAVRGFSDFGYSFVCVIFEEGTDIYWARTRRSERGHCKWRGKTHSPEIHDYGNRLHRFGADTLNNRHGIGCNEEDCSSTYRWRVYLIPA